MHRIRVLGEHRTLPHIVGPVPQAMKVKRAPRCDGRRRRLDPRERIPASPYRTHHHPSIANSPARRRIREATVNRKRAGNHP